MHPDGTGSTMGRLGWAAGGSLFAFGCLLAVTRWTRLELTENDRDP